MNKDELYKMIEAKRSGNFNEIFLKFNNNPLRNVVSSEIIRDIEDQIITWSDDFSPIVVDLLMSKDDDISHNSIKHILTKVTDENFLEYVIWKLEGSNKSEFLDMIIEVFNNANNSSLKYKSIITIFFLEDEKSKDFIGSLNNNQYYIPEIDKTISELIKTLINS